MDPREANPIARPEADASHVLDGLCCDASAALVQRTRRAVRDAAISIEEQRVRRRRSAGIALMVSLVISILLAPAVWISVEDLLGGEHIADLPAQVGFLLLMLSPAMLAALLAIWKGQRNVRHGRELVAFGRVER